MTNPRSLRWLLSLSIAFGAWVAHAGPEECLTLRDNIAVAGCANKYAPSPSGAPSPPIPQRRAVKEEVPEVRTPEHWMLIPVPPATAKVVVLSEPPEVIAQRDRSELIRRSGTGALGLVALGVAFGIWRWQASKVKRCSYCGTPVIVGAAVCKRCFRTV